MDYDAEQIYLDRQLIEQKKISLKEMQDKIADFMIKFPVTGRNKAVLVFTDAYGSNDYEEYIQYPVGQVIFFSTDEMSEEDFHFCFVKPDGELDEEASPMFIKIDKLLKPMSTEFLDNIVKPLKDLMKGVSIGA